MVGPTVSLRACSGEAWPDGVCRYLNHDPLDVPFLHATRDAPDAEGSMRLRQVEPTLWRGDGGAGLPPMTVRRLDGGRWSVSAGGETVELVCEETEIVDLHGEIPGIGTVAVTL